MGRVRIREVFIAYVQRESNSKRKRDKREEERDMDRKVREEGEEGFSIHPGPSGPARQVRHHQELQSHPETQNIIPCYNTMTTEK